MPLETIVFAVNGRPLAHVSAQLEASAEQAVRTAAFEIAHTGPGLPCAPDDEATITISGHLWGTGYVRDVSPSHDETRRCAVTFVSKTVDATECSIDHPTGFKPDCDLKQIAEEFDSYGIGIEGSAGTEKKRHHKVVPGETLFQTLETDARAQGVLIHDTPEGKLKLADKPEGRHSGGLVRGQNIISASASLSGRYAYSEVTVRGQASEGIRPTALRAEAKAKSGARRKRMLILPHEGEASSGRLKKRAAWEAKRAAGKATSCMITVPGFRDGAGRLWTRNFLVEVVDDWIGVNQDMVIASLSFDQGSDGGTTATLSLKDPRALGGENPRGSSADAWAAPSGIESEYREEE
ncbi:MAG: hypothetical protein LCH86_07720 [Proteobacteria bacterium]|nr:hypothetical protein [Pseudomonadota bacterium]